MATVRCPECGWVFRKESQLREHRALYHPGAQTEEPPSAEAPPPPATPERAGWYPDPSGQGSRYWDGSRWVDTTIPPGPPVSTGWLIASYVAAVVFPIAGLIAGIVVLTKGMRGHGLAVIAISIAIGAAGVLISSGDDDSGGGRSVDDKVDRIIDRSRQATDRCLREAGSSGHDLNKCIHDVVHSP
jgi:hypothetical protein